MFWFVCGVAGISLFLYRRKEQVKKAVVIAHYEAIYWILGGAGMIDDLIFKFRNHVKDLPKRSGDVAIVTGGSRGIGLEVVKKFLECDMHVIIGCRKVQAGLDAIDNLRQCGVMSGSAEVQELDTSSLRSVKMFASAIISKHKNLHLLVNNAGIMFASFKLTEDEFESQLAVNYIGHAYLTHLLLPLMKKTGRNSQYCSRIVNVSSCAHLAGHINFDDINFIRSSYIPTQAYAQSKLAQIMFSNKINRKLKEEGERVKSYAVHPGVVDTQLFDDTSLKKIAPWIPKLLFKRPEEGSRSIVFCALSQSLEDDEGGLYISNCGKVKPSCLAEDVAEQDKLMAKTMEILNLTEFCGIHK